MSRIVRTLTFFCVICLAGSLMAQSGVTLPQASPKVSLTQTIGLAEVNVTYSTPAVKERDLWGSLVPMDQVWRAGANENTTISFSHPVKVAGKELAAGTYGLHMIPGEKTWTVIFSDNSTSWGSYSYNEAEDILRVEVSPVEAPAHQERLAYSFGDLSTDGGTMRLEWGKMRVPVPMAFDTESLTLASIRNELRSTAGFSWMGYYQAANYANNQDLATEEAMGWVDQSINMNANFNNHMLKSQMLTKSGDAGAAQTHMDAALALGTEMELYQYGAGLIGQNKNEEAYTFFTEVMSEKYPDSWVTYAGLGAGHRVMEQPKKALKYYKMAHEGAPAQWKAALETRIKSVEEKMASGK